MPPDPAAGPEPASSGPGTDLQSAGGAPAPMRPGGGPLLPARRSRQGLIDQRRMRARELARLLPLLGVVLFFVPLLGSNARATGPSGIWLFACWGGLILVAALLARGLKRDLAPGGESGQDGR